MGKQMEYIDYMQLNWLQRLFYKLRRGITNLPGAVGRFFAAIGRWFVRLGRRTADFLRDIGHAFRDGDWRTRLSFFFMGSGCLFRGQIVKGFVYLAAEILFFLYFFLFGWHYLQDFNTLGTVEVGEKWNEELQIFEYTQGDNSMLILLFSVLTILLAGVFLVLYFASIRASFRAQRLREEGEAASLLPG